MRLTLAPRTSVLKQRNSEWVDRQFQALGNITKPAAHARRVVLTGFTRFGFSGKGKVYQGDYFPGFTRALADHDIDCHFVWTEKDLCDLTEQGNTAIIHLFNEELPWPYTEEICRAEANADVVFCSRRAGSIVSNKINANRYLSAQGIGMPPEVIGEDAGTVFSNSVIGSGKRVIVTSDRTKLPEGRYNTAFIDTRVDFGGKTWYTMFRIQAVGGLVHHAYVRARDTAERAPSVHSKDTPANAGLIEHLYDILVAPRRAEIHAHAKKMGDILGPGFYAHDMVVCRETGKMYMVEAGFKFNDSPYAAYLESVHEDTPSNRIFYDGTYPLVGAYLFRKEWDRALTQRQADPWMILSS